jgi:penicillin G amidase
MHFREICMIRRIALALAALASACSNGGKGSPFDAVPLTARIGGTRVGADVNVLFDGLGVPHVYASSDGDAAFAIGYVQARDRLFQMDVLRKIARGRTAEYVGASGTSSDVFVRTVMTSRRAAPNGSHHVEDVIAAQLSSEIRTLLERYRDGVNRFLADVRASASGATLPPQYLALGLAAQDVADWEVEDSIAVGRLQSFQLSETLQEELTAGRLAASIDAASEAVFLDVTRHAPAVATTILPPAAGAALAAPLRRTPRAVASPARSQLAEAKASLDAAAAFLAGVRLPFAHGDRAGSNNWTVSPRLSASGHALVANDPHLALGNPANFHMAHVVTSTRDVAGVTFPGTPVVVIGHNGRIGWGGTLVGYDVTDLYVEVLDAADTSVTFDDGSGSGPKQVPLQIITETHRVRGASQPESYRIPLVPHHGPLLPPDLSPIVNHRAISVRWTGQDPTFEVQAIYDLDAAKSVDEAFQALRSFGVGAQNFNIADVDGNIGYDPRAVVPVRANNDAAKLRTTCRPWLPMPGSGECEWTGVVPDAELPQQRGAPSAGYIVTANNDITGRLLDDDPVGVDPNAPGDANRTYLYAFTDIGFRAQRIRTRLEARPTHDLDSMTSIQADDHSDLADLMLPGLFTLLDPQRSSLSAGAQRALDLLHGWDRQTPTGVDSAGAPIPDLRQSAQGSTIFHAFLRRFAHAALDPGLGSALAQVGGIGALPSEQLMKIVVALVQPPADPIPPLHTGAALCGAPTCAAQAARALEETVAFLSTRAPLTADPDTWLWGKLHRVRFPFLGIDALDQLTLGVFSAGPFPNDGGLFTVDVANFPIEADTFTQTSGPNVRFSAEMDPNGVRWRAVIPGGQVDRPGDAHYEDQLQAWIANQPGDQPFAQGDVVKAARGRVVFSR